MCIRDRAWIGQDQRGDRLRQWAHASGATFAPGSDGAAQTPVAYATLDAVGRATYTFDLTWDCLLYTSRCV